MATPLDLAFRASSPRFARARMTFVSLAIHGTVLTLGLALIITALFADGIWTWAIGIAYVLYDTGLQAFTVYQTRSLCSENPSLAPRPDHQYEQDHEQLSVGIIIAAFNEAKSLPRTIEILLAQMDANDRLLIADDGSVDETPHVLAQAYKLQLPQEGALSLPSSQDNRLSWLRLSHGGKAHALNAGINVCDRDLIITIDADTHLEPGALTAIRSAFAETQSLVAATGVLSPVCAQGWRGRILEGFQAYEYMRNFLSRCAWMNKGALLLISGAFAAFRRSTLVMVGGFDRESLVEDYELIHRIQRYASHHQLPWTTAVIGSARARTEAPSSVVAFIRQRRRWFGGFLQTQYWYRDMVGNHRYGTVGTHLLPVKAVDALQPVFGVAALSVFAVVLIAGRFAIVWPVLVIAFAKIILDMLVHAWYAYIYRRWIGNTTRISIGPAILAALIEPFSFQFLRHASALLGWHSFLSGRITWGKTTRTQSAPPEIRQG